MLNAWIKGKRRDGITEREDEIVSAVFGPLKYLPGPARAEFFGRLVAMMFDEPPEVFVEAQLSFWKRLDRIEPDLIVNLERPDHSANLCLLFEFKWDSEQSPDQLSEQWAAARKQHDINHLRHLFVTRRSYSVEEMLDTVHDQNHANRLRNLTWARFHSFLRTLKLKGASNEFDCWRTDVLAFLTSLNEIGFSGFRLKAPRPVELKWRFQPRLMRIEDALRHYGPIPFFRRTWAFKTVGNTG